MSRGFTVWSLVPVLVRDHVGSVPGAHTHTWHAMMSWYPSRILFFLHPFIIFPSLFMVTWGFEPMIKLMVPCQILAWCHARSKFPSSSSPSLPPVNLWMWHGEKALGIFWSCRNLSLVNWLVPVVIPCCYWLVLKRELGPPVLHFRFLCLSKDLVGHWSNPSHVCRDWYQLELITSG